MRRRLLQSESDTLMALLYWERHRLLRHLDTAHRRADPGRTRNLVVQLRRLPHWRWHDRRWWSTLQEWQ